MTRYDVVYLDPPWAYSQTKNKGSLTTRGRGWKYIPMGVSELEALELPLRPDAHVYCWCTAPLLPTQLSVLEDAWGLRNVGVFRVWLKTCRRRTDHPYFGVGFYTAANAEFLVVGTRGAALPPPCVGRTTRHVVGAHSAKPAALRRAVSASTPHCTRLEMFARDESDPDFTYHGDQLCAHAAFQPRPVDVHARTRPKKRRRASAPSFEARLSGRYRVLWLDVSVDARRRLDVAVALDEHAFVLTRLDPAHPRASVDCYARWGLLYKTVLFVASNVDAPDATEVWLVGTSKTTRITAPDVKRRHRSSVVSCGADDVVARLASAVDEVFGADVSKAYVGARGAALDESWSRPDA